MVGGTILNMRVDQGRFPIGVTEQLVHRTYVAAVCKSVASPSGYLKSVVPTSDRNSHTIE